MKICRIYMPRNDGRKMKLLIFSPKTNSSRPAFGAKRELCRCFNGTQSIAKRLMASCLNSSWARTLGLKREASCLVCPRM